MAQNEYISKFSGSEIDDSIQKAKDIVKTAGEVNNSLEFIDKTVTNINSATIGEVMAKAPDGTFTGTGIINEDNKIFFPKDGRFPSGSIDVGPAITLSENGGYVQFKDNVDGADYLLVDYKIDKTGTRKPIYGERGAEVKDLIINTGDQTTMSDMKTFIINPIYNSQVNEVYFNYVNNVTNLRIKVTSTATGKVIKYIPNETAWKNGTNGISLTAGIRPIMLGVTPITLNPQYPVRIDFEADGPITAMGNGVVPWMKVDSQLITYKNVLVEGDAGGSETGATIKQKLEILTLDDRLDASAIKNIPSGSSDTAEQIKQKLETLTLNNRLDASAIKNLPSGTGGADIDLSNVDNVVFKAKGVSSGLLQQDLEDVDLSKLKEKVDAAGANLITVGETHGDYHQGDVKEIQFHNGLDVSIDTQNKVASIALFKDAYASTDLSNVLTKDLDQKFKETQTYKTIWNRLPQLKNVMAKYIEKQQALNLNEFNVAEQIIHINYQIVSENQTIQQALPSTSIGKVLMIQMIYSVGITNGSVVLTAANGEQFNGTSDPYTIDKQGMAGVAFSENLNWSWIPYPAMHEVGIGVNDQKSNFFIGMQELSFGAGFTATQDPTTKTTVKLDFDNASTESWVDTDNDLPFNPNTIKAPFKDIEIHKNVQGEITTANINIKPNLFEPIKPPGFLAYLNDDEEIIGKTTDTTYHKGVLFFDDQRKSPDPFISINRDYKSYGIQEWDSKDPNITGGNYFIIAFAITLKGIAPNSGIVRFGFLNKGQNPEIESTGYLEDVNGSPLVTQIAFAAGDKLQPVENKPYIVSGIVKATALKYFQCFVQDTFTDDLIELADPTEGGTSLMIQALGSTDKLGDAYQQFELDYGIQLNFSSHYLGAERMSINWITQRPEPITVIAANVGETLSDGYGLSNITPMKYGVVDNHLHFEDDGINICDFNFHRIFSAEETVMMRGKQEKVTVTLIDKDDAWNVSLMKWTGKPDEYTKEFYTSRTNNIPNFQTNWVEVEKMFISEDAVSGDHTQDYTFTIPTNANNYAFMIYPEGAQLPLLLKLKSFIADVVAPFIGWVEHYPTFGHEQHLLYDTEYKQFRQDNQGYVSVRYTINNTELPAPCGIPGDGLAKLTLDSTVNQIAGSNAKGGEGAIKAEIDAKLTLNTQLRLSNEQISGSSTQFWWATVGGSPGAEAYTKIPESELSVLVPAQSKNVLFRMPTFSINANIGDRFALRMITDSIDGAYMESSSPKLPMVQVNATLYELVTGSADAPMTILYIQDELQNDWEITAAADGHIQSMLVGDLPENIEHHVVRDNFSLNDFIVDTNGIITLVDKSVKQEYTEISTTTQHIDYKNYLVNTTGGIVYIDISADETKAFTVRDSKSKFDVNNCIIRIYDELNAVIHTATLNKKNKGYIFLYDGINWNYGEIGKGLIIAIASNHLASVDFIDAELQMDNMIEGANTKIMTANERTRLENMADNGIGDHWTSGLLTSETVPKSKSIQYSNGSYLINGLVKTIATGGQYSLLTHHTGMTNYQHAFVNIYVDNDQVIKSIRGTIAEKGILPSVAMLPDNSVLIAIVDIKVDGSGTPRDIANKDIRDSRCSYGVITDEYVKVSENDTTPTYLSNKLSNNGNVAFAIENVGGNETIKANCTTNEVYYVEDLTSASTASSTYVTKLSMTKNLVAGDYFIETAFECDSNTDALDFFSDITVDGITIGNEMIFEFKEKARPQCLPMFRRLKVTLTAGSHTIALRYKSPDGVAISTILQASILLRKVTIL